MSKYDARNTSSHTCTCVVLSMVTCNIPLFITEQQNGKGTEEEEPTCNYEAVKAGDRGATDAIPSSKS